MLNLEKPDIELLFQSGVLARALVVTTPMSTKTTYQAVFYKKDKEIVNYVRQRTNEVREFKSLDAAASFIKGVGFKKFEVEI